MPTIIGIIQIFIVPALSPLGIGVIRKLKAKLQNREGAGIFQPYRDLWKLFHKDEVISSDASWILRFAPYIIFGVTLFVGASIPIFFSLQNSFFASDILVIVYTLAVSTFFLALAGMDTGGGFGGFGASREMTVSALAEGGLIFSLLTVALRAGSTDLSAISAVPMSIDNYAFLPIILSFLGFFVVLLAENARFPFDNPSTHLELTMIHEAMILEHSGKRLALLEWASANKLLIFAFLSANLFFPWGIAHGFGLTEILVSVLVLGVKTFVLYAVVAVIESTMAKFRFFRLPDLLLVSFILSAVAITLI